MSVALLTVSAATIKSPNGKIELSVELGKGGVPEYSLNYGNKTVLTPSQLGLRADEVEFKDGFTIGDVNQRSFDETWVPVWGEYSKIRNNYNELSVEFKAQNPDRVMVVHFRVFDDGLGFRYEFPEQKNVNYMAVTREYTSFNLPADNMLYCIPGDYDTEEYLFSKTKVSDIEKTLAKYKGIHSESQLAEGSISIQTPMLMKSNDGLYVNIHEAALIGYPVMLLDVDPVEKRMSTHLVPDRLGKCAYIQIPFSTPWRTIIVSEDPRDILASQMILNLNEPSKIEDTSWIKPMKFVGVWWEMFVGGSTWAYSDKHNAKPGITDYTQLQSNGRHPANTENVKRYIDFAAKHGFDGVLVEGWNEGWEDWGGYRKNRQFRWDRPYPDFDLEHIRDYAASKGVKMIMHHETGANAADYERQLDQAFQFMKDNGYDAVKTGYVGAIIPRSEHHSSQWMVEHVEHVTKRAADFKIMVDSHEAPHPTGLIRTYPNWVAQETARGGEFESFGGNPPSHTCILPFTRLKGGPMDYTPGLFEPRLANYGKGVTSQGMTTLARQLALYVTMPSPIQMACDLIENYEKLPEPFQFIKDVAIEWEDSKYLEAEPMEYITVSRKDKNSADWFVGAITDENPRNAVVDCCFLPTGVKYEATIYADGKDASWKENPQSYAIRKITVDSKSKIKQLLASGGGMAIRLTPKK